MTKLLITPLGLLGGSHVRLNEVDVASVTRGGVCPVGAVLK